jgi:hypothetical protein
MGGPKRCSEIQNDSVLKTVSIILVCGVPERSLPERRKEGANVVIQKPIGADELLWNASELLVVPEQMDIRELLLVLFEAWRQTSHVLPSRRISAF